MKAIILAAGMGTRLGTLIPKPLTSLINEKTILDYQIEKLSKKIGGYNILAVVGYKKEIIMEKHPELLYVYNDAYVKTNTSKSLLKALKFITNEDVLWLNGDVYFDENVLDLLLNKKNSTCLVDTKKTGEEEIKYTLNDEGFIYELSKTVKNAIGEAVGINLIKKNDLIQFTKELEKVDDNDYFEKALENLTKSKKINLEATDLKSMFCKEIDFEEDLETVRAHIIASKK